MNPQTKKERNKSYLKSFGAVSLTVAFAIVSYPKQDAQQRVQQVVSEKKSTEYQPRVAQEKPKESEQIYVQPDRILQAADYKKGRTQTLDTIVLHTTEGSAEGAIHHLTSPEPPEVSAHYIITKEGKIIQLVHPNDTAYHVRGWNARSIGIEFEGNYNKPLTREQLKKGAGLISFLQKSYGQLFIKAHAELDPSRRKDPGKENYRAILAAVESHQPNR
jgi:N-acetyl-anhydromuramyl-L-alanine amidase AmpD